MNTKMILAALALSLSLAACAKKEELRPKLLRTPLLLRVKLLATLLMPRATPPLLLAMLLLPLAKPPRTLRPTPLLPPTKLPDAPKQ